MIQGLNNKLTVYRAQQGEDDVVGGAEIAGRVAVYRDVLCRVESPRGSRREQMMEIDLARAVSIVIWPATYTIKADDEVLVALGRFANQRFVVRDIKEDSLAPTHPNAHIEVTAERVDYGRSTP